MERQQAFGACHPAVTAVVLAAAIVLGVLARRPSYLIVNVVFAASSYRAVRGRTGLRLVAGVIPLAAIVALANPLFAALGDTILFTYLGGRPYTLEALCFGASMGATLAGTLLWFGCWNAVMTTDKLTYLLGRFAPSLALVLTMALRLVPGYERALKRFGSARSCLGEAASAGSPSGRARHAATLLSQLTTWALESAVTASASMRARGFGVGSRSSFAPFRFGARDAALLAFALACALVAGAGALAGSAGLSYYPVIALPPATPLSVAGLAAFAALAAMPSFVTLREAAAWRISLSRI